MAHVAYSVKRETMTLEQLAHVEEIVVGYNFGRTIAEIGGHNHTYVRAVLHWASENGWEVRWHPNTFDWINTP